MKHLSELAGMLLGLARLKESEVLLDVGAGDGLIAFAALPQLGEHGRVILADTSHPLLEHARSALDKGVLDRCEFVEASADDLALLSDASVDILTTRGAHLCARQALGIPTKWENFIAFQGNPNILGYRPDFQDRTGNPNGTYAAAGRAGSGQNARVGHVPVGVQAGWLVACSTQADEPTQRERGAINFEL